MAGPNLGIFRIGEKYDKNKRFDESGFYSRYDDDDYGNSSYSNYDERYNYRDKLKVNRVEEEPKVSKSVFSVNVEGEDINQAKINEILDKISASGYQSLTDREKTILIEISKKL